MKCSKMRMRGRKMMEPEMVCLFNNLKCRKLFFPEQVLRSRS
jgi:hypothetical protein